MYTSIINKNIKEREGMGENHKVIKKYFLKYIILLILNFLCFFFFFFFFFYQYLNISIINI